MPTLFETGDALRGDRVAISARQLSRTQVISLTGRHRAQQVVARDNVFCVIEMPLRIRPRDQRNT